MSFTSALWRHTFRYPENEKSPSREWGFIQLWGFIEDLGYYEYLELQLELEFFDLENSQSPSTGSNIL